MKHHARKIRQIFSEASLQRYLVPMYKFNLVVYLPILATLIGVVILTAFYATPYGDDYYSIPGMSIYENGFINFFEHLFNKVAESSRPAQEIFAHISYGLLGNSTPVILPIITAFLFVITGYLYFGKVPQIRRLNAHRKFIQLCLSIILFVFCIYLSRSLSGDGSVYSYQLFFFSSAIVTYTLPLLTILLAIYYFMLSGRAKRYRSLWPRILIFILLTFLLTANEVMAPGLIVAIALPLLAYIILRLVKRKSRLRDLIRSNVVINSTIILVGSLASLAITIPLKKSRMSANLAGSDYSLYSNLSNSIGETIHILSTTIFRPTDILTSLILSVLLVLFIHIYTPKSKVNYIRILYTGLALLIITILLFYVSRVLSNAAYGLVFYQVPRTTLLPHIMYSLTLLTMSIGVVGIAINTLPRRGVTIALTALIACLAVSTIAIPRILDRASGQLEASIKNNYRWHSRDKQIIDAIDRGESSVYLDDTTDGISDIFIVHCEDKNLNPSWIWYREGMSDYYNDRIRICNSSELP